MQRGVSLKSNKNSAFRASLEGNFLTGQGGNLTGFTTIEALIVVALIGILTALAVVYSTVGEARIVLFREQVKMASIIYKAKALSIETFSQAAVPCGYGVRLEPPDSYLLFKDLDPNCQVSDRVYSGDGSGELLESFNLDSRIIMLPVDSSDILFVPPDPRTYITPNPIGNQVTIGLAVKNDNNQKLEVKVNIAGQISY